MREHKSYPMSDFRVALKSHNTWYHSGSGPLSATMVSASNLRAVMNTLTAEEVVKYGLEVRVEEHTGTGWRTHTHV